MLLSNMPCQCLAAYLYVLQLDAVALAWEYLRRNPKYRRCWNEEVASSCPAAHQWGLLALEDPDLDARRAQPLWTETPADTVWLSRAAEGRVAKCFSLRRIPGHQQMTHDGTRVRVQCSAGNRTLRLALTTQVEEGGPFAYALASSNNLRERYSAIQRVAEYLFPPGVPGHPPSRPSRVAWTHLRALQALDARLAGASHREVAVCLFGAPTVAQRWSEDGELRARVRYLVRRGRALSEGGYLRLMGVDAAPPG